MGPKIVVWKSEAKALANIIISPYFVLANVCQFSTYLLVSNLQAIFTFLSMLNLSSRYI